MPGRHQSRLTHAMNFPSRRHWVWVLGVALMVLETLALWFVWTYASPPFGGH